MFKRIFKKKQKGTQASGKDKPVDLQADNKGKIVESKSANSETDNQEQPWEPSSSGSSSRNSTSHELSWSLPFRARPIQTHLLPAQDREDEGKMCLVLDMDETLIHCAFLDMQEEKFRQTLGEDRKTDYSTAADYVFEVSSFQVEVRCRPGLKLFLEKCSKVFELVVFTASLEEYASKAMDLIDPEGLVKHRLFRPATVTYRGVDYVKDLSRLGRDMQRCVLIDNNHLAMLASPENSIAINDFMGDPTDSELYGAYDMLMTMKDLTDVRPFIKDTFKTHLEIAEIFEQMEIGVPEDSIPPRAGTDVSNASQPSCQYDIGRPVQVHTEEKKVDSLPTTALPPPIQIPRSRASPPNLELEDDSYGGSTPRVLAATYSHQFATPMRMVPRRLGEEPLDELMQLPPVAPGAEGFVAEVDDPVVSSFQLCLTDAENSATVLGRKSQNYMQPGVSPGNAGGLLQEVGL